MYKLMCLLLLANSAIAAPPMPIEANHPILGTWVLPIANGKCLETYYFRADGSTLVTSAEEVAETAVEISPKPSRRGFYRWIDKLVKDNGKKDCSGKISKVGTESTSFIRFLDSGEKFVVCQDESLEACFGPLLRVHGQDS